MATHAAAEGRRRAEDCGSGTAVSINLPLPLSSVGWLKLPSPLLLLLLHSHFLLPSPPLFPFITLQFPISSLPKSVMDYSYFAPTTQPYNFFGIAPAKPELSYTPQEEPPNETLVSTKHFNLPIRTFLC